MNARRSHTALLALGLLACIAPPQSNVQDDETPKWNVDEPPGPTSEVAIDTREGTWMSVDVSPDGRELVFDLLGDLYVLPITGGDALALTHGMAWDMQPRYSPDGETIAFTSDRGGGDNVWVIDRDGRHARQVTKEDYRLVNSPAWTPDGRFIAARKHFTSHRSLGAGEIWLYHVAGGEGLQMTEKPNEQKDVGEPAFSPDGRYLYTSHDQTPGDEFEYNKNPYESIYAISRLDRETGRIETFVEGAGGAVRPTPSPDGKSLAFVRRVRAKTVLFLATIASGAERPLFDGLDRDMQETWAIHGVYPAMGWLPDSSAIVLWAQGGLWRVDVETGAASAIPFHVQDERTVSEPLRFPHDVAPESFDVRVLRWAEISPDGSAVVYGALGHIWIKDLPDGTPRRLTDDERRFEYYPSWSRDGELVAYVSWHDEELGAVRVVPRTGGTGRALTGEPGHWVQPSFSPDGASVVAVKVAGGGLVSPHWSRDVGIYLLPVAGGEPQLISRSGVRPHFGARGTRVFFQDFEDEDERVLKSLRLEDREVRVLLRSEAATEFRVSPDDRWIAFAERFSAYVVPFPATGREVAIGPENEALPKARVSARSAEFLRWTAGGAGLSWTLGPELFRRELTEAFEFLEGARTPLPEAPRAGLRIGFQAPSDVPDGAVAFVGARVVTMRGDEVLEDGTVVVEENRIVAVGPRAEVQVPDGAFVVDASGCTILPGLVDVHAHGPQGANGIQPQQSWLNLASLAFGVTTVHDPSNDTHDVFGTAELARAGLVTAPRIFSTGAILYGASGTLRSEVKSVEDARFHLDRMQAYGAFSVKSYNQPRREQRQQVLAAARELEMLVVPEGGSLFQHNMTMVVDGHTGIEHAIPVAVMYDDVHDLWGGTDVAYTPTLVVAYGGIWSRTTGTSTRTWPRTSAYSRSSRARSSIAAHSAACTRSTATGTTCASRPLRRRSPTPEYASTWARTANARDSERTGSSGTSCKAA